MQEQPRAGSICKAVYWDSKVKQRTFNVKMLQGHCLQQTPEPKLFNSGHLCSFIIVES